MGCAMIPPPPELELEAPAVSLTTGQAGTAPETRILRRCVPSSADNIFISRSRFSEICLFCSALSGVVERSAPTFHSRPFFIARFASRCVVPKKLPVLQPDHTSINQGTKFIASCNSLSQFQCFRTSLYRPGHDNANSGCRQDVRWSLSICPTRCQGPTTNPICPLGLQTLLPELPLRS